MRSLIWFIWFASLVLVPCGTSCRRSFSCEYYPSTKAQIASFKTALDCFEMDCDRLPSTAEGFAPLFARPADVPEKHWHGPYLESIPKDPWGQDYVYRYPGLHNTNGFDVFYRATNGVEIGNWRERRD